MAMAAKPIPDGYPVITPYLMVAGAAEAIAFYKRVFGALERMRMEAPGGRIGHAELTIGNSVLMVADEFPDMDCKGPRAYGGSPVTLHLYVDDVDTIALRAQAAGAKVIRPVADQFYGDRSGMFEDPFGHVWNIATHVEDVAADEMRRRADEAMKGMEQA